jgi:hypothetical protein
LLIVLNHGHRLLLNIGRFNSSYIKTRLIVTLLHPSPRRGDLVLRLGVEVARLVSLAQLARRVGRKAPNFSAKWMSIAPDSKTRMGVGPLRSTAYETRTELIALANVDQPRVILGARVTRASSTQLDKSVNLA